ncbi:50S ribosomal protein L32 [bacterium]|nr:50S ribosomal protein L32 [candidate division CSSED10-310 bacterium]
MPVPKQRTSKSRGRMRRAHQALKAPNLSICPHCEALKVPHQVCLNCGYYKGKKILDIEEA